MAHSNEETTGDQNQPLSDYIDLERIYFLVLRKLWLVLTITALVCIGFWAWLSRQPKLYTARAVIQVEQNEQKLMNMQDVSEVDPTTRDYIATVIQTMTSRPVLIRVVKSLNLANEKDFGPPRTTDRPYTDDQLAAILLSRIEITTRKATRVIDVMVDDTDPVRAQKLASALVKEFFRESFEQRMTLSRTANSFLQDEADKLKVKLEASERKLQDYREKNKAVSLEERQNIIVEKLREINSKVTDAKSARLRLESDLQQLRKVDPNNLDAQLAIGSVSALPQVANIREQLVNAEADLAATRERYLHKHPKMIAATTRIANLKVSLKDAIGKAGDILSGEYAASQDNEAKLEEALKEQEARSLELSSIAIPYGVLQREVDSDRGLYDALMKRLRETSIMEGVEQVPFRVIEEPLVPTSPSKPRIPLLVGLAGFATFVICLVVIIGRDILDSSLKTVDDAENYLGLPALAAVPDLQSRKRLLLQAAKDAWKKKHLPDYGNLVAEVQQQENLHPLVLVKEPASPAAEAFRTLRTSIAFLGKAENHRSFIISSAVPSEGKTFSSLNSAVAFAQQDLRTLIIDADLRKPKIQKDLFPGSGPMKGLSDLLTGQSPLADVLHPTEVKNLTVIPAGSRCPNPAELLGKADFAALIDSLLQKFDRVIFDTAPINAVSDTLPLCRHVQSVVLVVRAGKTPRKAVRRAVSLLQKSGGNVVGIVFNRLPSGRGAGYYYYYYGEKYADENVYGTTSV